MICLVFGGESCEHDISVITALSVYNAIKNDMEVTLVYMKNKKFFVGKKLSDISSYKNFCTNGLKEAHFSDGKIHIKTKFGYSKNEVECVIMCNHGGCGEDGCLSGYFETVGIPYTASGALGCGLCMDKAYCKSLLEKFKLPTVSFKIYRPGDDIGKIAEMGFPLIIKPARNGSSVGISVADDTEELENSIELALRFDDKLVIEKALSNFREFNCAVFSDGKNLVVSDIEEVRFADKYLDFNDKYSSLSQAERIIPAVIPDKLKEKIINFTKKIYCIFELGGVVRTDFLHSDGKLYINEINAIPGSMACYLFRQKNIDTTTIMENIIIEAKERKNRKSTLEYDFASNVLKEFDGIKGDGIKK